MGDWVVFNLGWFIGQWAWASPSESWGFHQFSSNPLGEIWKKKPAPSDFRPVKNGETMWNQGETLKHHPSRGDISLHRSSKSLKGAHALRKLREMVESSPSGPKLLSASQNWPPKLLTSTHHLKTVPSFYLNWNVMKHLHNQVKMRSAIQENF